MVKEDHKFGLKQKVNLSKKGKGKKERVKVNCPFIWTNKVLSYLMIAKISSCCVNVDLPNGNVNLLGECAK